MHSLELLGGSDTDDDTELGELVMVRLLFPVVGGVGVSSLDSGSLMLLGFDDFFRLAEASGSSMRSNTEV